MLEKILSCQRARLADGKIPLNLREGRILDVGCGETPVFLKKINFREKFGIDRLTLPQGQGLNQDGVTIINQDFECQAVLPFPDGHFEAVTMLAVFEHIEPDHLPGLLNEIYRILAPQGVFVLTTPAPWADGLLHLLAKLHMVNPALFAEHKDAYSHKKLKDIFLRTKFEKSLLSFGYFECYLNIWMTVQKS